MADIPVERKGGMGWLWWVLGLLALVLVIWIVVAAADDDDDVAEVVDTDVVAVEPMATGAEASLSDIMANPAMYIGQPFPTAEVGVSDNMTDRGFWIEEGGQRLFAVLIDEPLEVPIDINPGQRLRISGGTLRAPSYLSEMPGKSIDQDTRNIVDGLTAFLAVDESNIEILSR